MVTTTSEKLTPFLAAHEGFVSKAYKCPAGVVTIGYGMTGRSKVFASYWRAKTGRVLRLGDTISRADADAVLTEMLAAEYSPPVARVAPNASQHAFDGATSVSYNCGPGALRWKWAQALGRGDVKGAAALLRNTAITANGRVLSGLKRRRKEESACIEHGDYGPYGGQARPAAPPSESTGVDDVMQYQGWLKQLGYYKGDVDGDPGPVTEGAVRNFQRASDLVVDGKVGPATRSALIRALDAQKAKTAIPVSTGAGATGGAVASGGEPLSTATPADPSAATDLVMSGDAIVNALIAGGIVLAVAVVAFIVWRNRGRITGRRVPT